MFIPRNKTRRIARIHAGQCPIEEKSENRKTPRRDKRLSGRVGAASLPQMGQATGFGEGLRLILLRRNISAKIIYERGCQNQNWKTLGRA